MRFRNLQFRPLWWASLATFALVALLCWLGFWQLDRAAQKRSLGALYAERAALSPVVLNRAQGPRTREEAMAWRRVEATGSYDGAFQILLDNQVVAGIAGYFVFTPFRFEGEDAWVLVNRGWVAAGPDRRVVPEVLVPSGVVTLRGVAKPPPEIGLVLGEPMLEALAPGTYRAPLIDRVWLSDQMGRDLLPYVVRLDPAMADGFLREWRVPGTGEARHLGYAFQWFALAVTLFLIYVFVNLKRARPTP